MKKGISTTIVGIIIVVVVLALILFLIFTSGDAVGENIQKIIESLDAIRGGGGIV